MEPKESSFIVPDSYQHNKYNTTNTTPSYSVSNILTIHSSFVWAGRSDREGWPDREGFTYTN